MGTHSCVTCGAMASVTVSSVRGHRAGDPAPAPSTERHLCRACASAEGVPLRAGPAVPLSEPEPPNWASVREHLAVLELILPEQTEGPAFVREFLTGIRRFARHIADPMPPDVAAQIARLEQDSA